MVDGKLNIDEANEKLGTKFSNEHYDTIGGLTFGLIGKEPNVGDEVENNGYILKVEVKDKQRVKQIRLKKVPTVILPETNNKKSRNNNKLKKEEQVDITTVPK